MSKFQLACCDGKFSPDTITYRHDTLNQEKWNDHFLVSESILQHGLLNGFTTIDEGDNQSDHFPIQINLSAKERAGSHSEENEFISPPILKWAKLSDGHKEGYTERLRVLVDGLPDLYLRDVCQNKCVCDNAICQERLQNEYDILISCLKSADASLPRFKPGTERDWWTSNLSVLRRQSIEIHTLWNNLGRPRHGTTNDERLQVKAAYKREIRQAQRAPK